MPAVAPRLRDVAGMRVALQSFRNRKPNLISASLSLTWYLVFLAIFAVFPFLFLRKFREKIVPWAAAALAGPAQFLLIYRLVKIAYPNRMMGLLPAAFALPGLLSLVVVLKKCSAESRRA